MGFVIRFEHKTKRKLRSPVRNIVGTALWCLPADNRGKCSCTTKIILIAI